MALSVSATTSVAASPKELLEFVLDLDRYREADHKILRVSKVEGPDENGLGSARVWGRLRWGPPAPDRQDFKLERWRRLTFTGASGQPARLVFSFVGSFECEATSAGTVLTHAYEFTFTPPFRVVERFLAGWLQDEIEAEVARIAEIFARQGA